jgi:hypothetical protein
MNGFCLLVALATVGVDVGYEQTLGGNLVYTIRIEAIVLDQLRKGSAIQTAVDAQDRNLRKFRVAMGPKGADKETRTSTIANEVDYGWRANEEGGMDYYVQIPPDRLETLSKGFPIDCQVHVDVTDINTIYVFVGTAELPREPAPNTNPYTSNEPQYLRGADNTTRPATGGVTPVSGQDSRVGTPVFNDESRFRSDNTARATLSDNTRPTYDQSSRRPDDGRWTSETRRGSTGVGTYGPEAPTDYSSRPTSRQNDYNRFRDDTLPVPDSSRDTRNIDRGGSQYDRYGGSGYDSSGYGGSGYGGRTETVARQTAPHTQAPAAPARSQQPAYAPPLTQAQNPQPPNYQQPANNWQQAPAAAAPNYSVAQLPPNYVQQQQPATTTAAEEEVRPWTPLILTTLALFASIGANGYLGWLAWSFFWRFRDSASDLARARTAATSVRAA